MNDLWVGESEGQLPLSEKEKALRNEFVRNYLLDFDPVLACMRVGFTKAFADDWSVRFMSEPYVQQRIMTLSLEAPEDDKAQEEKDKQLTLTVLREAAQRGPYASRVAAAAKLAAIYGMDKPVTNSLDVNHRGGVMMVPGIGNIDDWEKEAVASQTELTKEAREQ